MKLLCVDDADAHISALKNILRIVETKEEMNFEILETASNGLEGFNAYNKLRSSGTKIDLITLDIRMPVLDGLSALVKIRSIDPIVKCLMVSTEDEAKMKRLNRHPSENMTEAQKFTLLDKVASRVKAGIKEEGKVNFMLDACEELCIDPIIVAKKFKANGYLHKPFNTETVIKTLKDLNGGSGYSYNA